MRGHPIHEVDCNLNSFGPKSLRLVHGECDYTCSLEKMSIFSLYDSILLRNSCCILWRVL